MQEDPTTPPSRRSPSGKSRASLFSRLSLSPNKRAQASTTPLSRRDAPPPVSPKNPARIATSHAHPDRVVPKRGADTGKLVTRVSSGRVMAGPAYESMANGPMNQSTHSSSQSRGDTIDFSQKPLPLPDHHDRSPNRGPEAANRGGKEPVRDISRQERSTSQSNIASRPHFGEIPGPSPPKARQPIYPALASPPRHREARPSPPPFASSKSMTPVILTNPPTGPASTHAPISQPDSPLDQASPRGAPAARAARTSSASRELKAKARPDDLRIVTSSTTSPIQRAGSGGSRTHSSSPVSPLRQHSMQIIASSSTGHREANGYRYDKNGRPLMSARRSATSSSKTITRGDSSVKTALPSPISTPVPGPGPIPPLPNVVGVSEASAYAKAVASTMHRPIAPASPPRARSSEAVMSKSPKSKTGRPLPRPPGEPEGAAASPRRSSSHQVLPSAASHRDLGHQKQTSSPGKHGASEARDSIDFHFSRSPSIPALVDPRQVSPLPVINGSSPAEAIKTPPYVDRAVVSQAPPLTTNGVSSIPSDYQPPRAVNGASIRRPAGKLPLDFLLSHPSIQAAVLSTISINAFLSLTGSSEVIRHQFTGESVGRWVLREWAVQCPTTTSIRWPNLTVWEGFLESLLHDPATYSTYPARWHNLLRHLSLSHTLVVLYLRTFPSACFPNHSLLPFEDEASFTTTFPFSPSSTSLTSLGQPRSRVASVVGSDTASLAASSSKAPRRERVVEIIMPEPLAAQPTEEIASPEPVKPIRRRGSISSLASAASFSFGRKRSNSHANDVRPPSRVNGVAPVAEPTASLPPGKGAPPPVSYPSAKRYGFKAPNDPPSRSRNSSISQRPGSIFSMQTSPSSSSYAPRMSQAFDLRAPSLGNSQIPLTAPPPIGIRPRSSFGSSESTRRSDRDQNSPVPGRRMAFPNLQAPRCEPAFDRPMPYIPGRAPVLRVFVPLSEAVRRWPSAEGAVAAVTELEKCGALKRMQLGDLIVNTAIRAPRTTEHVLVYVPFVKHLLVPLQYVHVATGHLPAYVDAFALPPSYYYPFLPAPQIVHLNLGPYRDQGLRSMRLASDRRDMTVSSGAKISAKRYLYVAGVEIRPEHKAAAEWQGMISLEAEGTAEGKADLEARFGDGSGRPAPLAPWEIVKEKSMGGTVWLRLIRQRTT